MSRELLYVLSKVALHRKQALIFGAGIPEMAGAAAGVLNAPSGSSVEGLLRGGIGAGLGSDLGAVAGAGAGGLGGGGLGALLAILTKRDPKEMAALGAILGTTAGGAGGLLAGGYGGYQHAMGPVHEGPPPSRSHQIIEHRRSGSK